MAHKRDYQQEFGSKVDALVLRPGLVCRRKESICDIVGYVVYDGDTAIASARTAQEAWWKAYLRLQRKAVSKRKR